MYNSQRDKMLTVDAIVSWLDDRSCTLSQCFKDPKKIRSLYDNLEKFLKDLNDYTEALSNSSAGWQGQSG